MPFVSVNFIRSLEVEKRYFSSTNDEWAHMTSINQNLDARQEYTHHIRLVARSDEQDLPIQAIFPHDRHVCLIQQDFAVGVTVLIFSNQENLRITYFSCDICLESRLGSLTSDLIAHGESTEQVELQSSEGQTFFINKFVFESRSKVFRAMLAHGTRESHENKVQFQDISSSVLEDLVTFLKTDKVPKLSINAIKLGFIADQFELPKLSFLVQLYLKSNITRENYEKVAQLACTSKSDVLQEALSRFNSRRD